MKLNELNELNMYRKESQNNQDLIFGEFNIWRDEGDEGFTEKSP